MDVIFANRFAHGIGWTGRTERAYCGDSLGRR